jgi:hypothetical protein
VDDNHPCVLRPRHGVRRWRSLRTTWQRDARGWEWCSLGGQGCRGVSRTASGALNRVPRRTPPRLAGQPARRNHRQTPEPHAREYILPYRVGVKALNACQMGGGKACVGWEKAPPQ